MLRDAKTGRCRNCSRPRPPPSPKVEPAPSPVYRQRICQECGEPYLGVYCANGHAKPTGSNESAISFALFGEP